MIKIFCGFGTDSPSIVCAFIGVIEEAIHTRTFPTQARDRRRAGALVDKMRVRNAGIAVRDHAPL